MDGASDILYISRSLARATYRPKLLRPYARTYAFRGLRAFASLSLALARSRLLLIPPEDVVQHVCKLLELIICVTAKTPNSSSPDYFSTHRIVRVAPLGNIPTFQEFLAKTRSKPLGLYHLSSVIFLSVAAQRSKASRFSLS